MRAKDVMSRGVMSVTSDATIFEAAEALTKCSVSAMPVVDEDGGMVGIVSEADLIRRAEIDNEAGSSSPLLRQLTADIGAAAAYVQANSHRVVDVMTRNVITVDETASLSEVAELMVHNGIKRLPVRSGRSIVGMISRMDLLRALLPRLAGGEDAKEQVELPSTDEDIRCHVEAATRNQSWSVAGGIDVAVIDGVVHLWGRVPSETVALAHLIAVGKVPGVKGIENHLHIVQPTVRFA